MKTALVTGGSRGIGEAIVRLLSKSGYCVAFTYKNSEERALLVARESGALAIRADNTDENEIKNAVDTAVRELGRIDCLVNNAGVSVFGLVTETETEEWERVFKTNVDGAYKYVKYTVPDMLKRHSGRIINISSVWGLVGSSNEVCYSSAKAALVGMTKALAKELAPSGITVNGVAPGVIETEMNGALSVEEMAELVGEIPLGRIGRPEEVAQAVVFLAGEGGSYITGEVINVSGGFVIN